MLTFILFASVPLATMTFLHLMLEHVSAPGEGRWRDAAASATNFLFYGRNSWIRPRF